MKKIEKSIYISDVSLLRKIKKGAKISRIYYGEEFCQFCLPEKAELETVLDYVRENNLQFTFVTPWLTDESFDKVVKLLKIIPPKSEVVINDYGLLMLDMKKFDFIPVLGRLLNGQIRGLRKDYEQRLSKKSIEYFKSSQPQVEILSDFYKEKGINRIELDNLPQGLKSNLINMGFSGSLYYPFGYITVTRFCPFVTMKNRFGLVFSINKCNKRCRDAIFNIENKETNSKIFIKGNYQFYKKEGLPENLLEMGIDRIVEEFI